MAEVKEMNFQGPARPPLAMPSAPGTPSVPGTPSTPTNPSAARPKLYRRQSRFTEEPMTERTPACSASIHSFDPTALDDPNISTLTHTNTIQQFRTANRTVSRDLSHRSSNLRRDLSSFSFGGAPATPVVQEEVPWQGGMMVRTGTLEPQPQPLSAPTTAEIPPPSGLHPPPPGGLSPAEKKRIWLRLANSVLHSAPALVLLYIMSTSISAFRSGRSSAKYSSPGITLLSMLYLDAILNILTCFWIRHPWPTWRLSLRVVFGLGYIILFFIYIGFGLGVFPKGWTYWNIPEHMATPVVYIFLWWLGVWDLLHLPVCRPWLFNCGGKREEQQEGRRPSVALSELHPTSFRARVPSSAGGASVVSYTWRRWVQRTRTHSTGGGVHFHEGMDEGREDVEMGTTRTRTREEMDEEGSRRRSGSMRTGSAHSGDVTLRGDDATLDRRSNEKEKEAEAGMERSGGAGKKGEDEEGRLGGTPKMVRAADIGHIIRDASDVVHEVVCVYKIVVTQCLGDSKRVQPRVEAAPKKCVGRPIVGREGSPISGGGHAYRDCPRANRGLQTRYYPLALSGRLNKMAPHVSFLDTRDDKAPDTSDNAVIWIVISIVAGTIGVVAALTTLVVCYTKRHQYKRAKARDPYLTREEFSRKRKLSANDLFKEEENWRGHMIHKSLASRSTNTLEQQQRPQQDQGHQGYHEQQQGPREEQQPQKEQQLSPAALSAAATIHQIDQQLSEMERKESTRLKEDWKRWEAQVRHERSASGEQHPAIAASHSVPILTVPSPPKRRSQNRVSFPELRPEPLRPPPRNPARCQPSNGG
ncbi:hypothetical protein QBC40DRAFT_297027 [Triangularia verruculosa]|uniref:Uncharacterized protein n=1 Tax=Triangularia verruculosa TaxID=2587418 RepID=A0AAN6XK44_9PEZI|nr:hypothetical protein QBC40DRAFT_297027 [Triangularia verruculosa]